MQSVIDRCNIDKSEQMPRENIHTEWSEHIVHTENRCTVPICIALDNTVIQRNLYQRAIIVDPIDMSIFSCNCS